MNLTLRQLRILQKVAAGPCRLAEIVAETGIQRPAVHIELTVLSASGLLNDEDDDLYTATETGQLIAAGISREVREKKHHG